MQRANRGLDFAQSHHRQQRALQLPDAHAPCQFRLAALTTVGEHDVLGIAALRGAPDLTQLHQLPVVERVFGGQRADAQLFVSGMSAAGAQQRERQQADAKESLQEVFVSCHG